MEYIYIYVLVKKINPFKTHFSLLDIFLINLITKIQRIYKIKSVYIIKLLEKISYYQQTKRKR